MYLRCDVYSYDSSKGMGVKIDTKSHSGWMKYFRFSSTYVSYFLLSGSCVISRQLCPPVLLLPSKIRALVLRGLTDLGPWLVIRALQIRLKFYFVILKVSFFLFLWCQRCTVSPPSVFHWWFWSVTVAFIFLATLEKKDYYVFEIWYTGLWGCQGLDYGKERFKAALVEDFM